jgi:hypothetical protein
MAYRPRRFWDRGFLTWRHEGGWPGSVPFPDPSDVDQQYHRSEPVFEVTSGGFAANRLPTRVSLTQDLYGQASVSMTTRDGIAEDTGVTSHWGQRAETWR